MLLHIYSRVIHHTVLHTNHSPNVREKSTIWFHSNLYADMPLKYCHINTTNNAYLVLQNFSHNTCLVLGVCGPQTLAALPPMMHVWSSKFQAMDTLLHYHQQCILAIGWDIGPQKCHQTSTDNACLVLGILDHAQKLHISNNACLVFKNLGHTYIATRSYKIFPPTLATSAVLFCPEIRIH